MSLWNQIRDLFVDESDGADRTTVKSQIDQVRSSRQRADIAIDELQAQAEQAIKAHLPPPPDRYDVAAALRQARHTARGRDTAQRGAP